jgi:hypothetical protein
MSSAVQLAERLRAIAALDPTVEARHLLELAAVLAGHKPVARVVVEAPRVDAAASRLRALGLAVAEPRSGLAVVRETSLGDRYTEVAPLDDPRVREAAIHCARDTETAALARDADEGADAGTIGRLLGYPSCCVTAYARVFEDHDWLDTLLEGCGRLEWLDPDGNKLAYLFDGASLLPDYFPCSLRCAQARRLAALLRTAGRAAGLDGEVEAAEAAMRRPLIVWSGLVIQPDDDRAGPDGLWAFEGGRARCFDWRPARPFPRSWLDGVGGVRADASGVALLDARLEVLPAGRDARGHLLRFDGGAR